jgi:hypothetical protein
MECDARMEKIARESYPQVELLKQVNGRPKDDYTKTRLNIWSQREPPLERGTREFPQRIFPDPTRCGVW